MRKATLADFFGDHFTTNAKNEYENDPVQPEKVLDYRKQKEYGQKKRIKP